MDKEVFDSIESWALYIFFTGAKSTIELIWHRKDSSDEYCGENTVSELKRHCVSLSLRPYLDTYLSVAKFETERRYLSYTVHRCTDGCHQGSGLERVS